MLAIIKVKYTVKNNIENICNQYKDYLIKVSSKFYDIRIHSEKYMVSRGVFVRVSEELLEEFMSIARSRGLSRSEAIRRAMEEFIIREKGVSLTSKMKGLVKSRFSLKELEELYLVSK